MPSGQVSMLLSSVERGSNVKTALGAGSATDHAGTEATAAFIADFNAALGKESSHKAVASQRQLTAALNSLPDAELEMTVEQADERLSSNLLQQIALTNANKNNAGAKVSSDSVVELEEITTQVASEANVEITLASDNAAVMALAGVTEKSATTNNETKKSDTIDSEPLESATTKAEQTVLVQVDNQVNAAQTSDIKADSIAAKLAAKTDSTSGASINVSNNSAEIESAESITLPIDKINTDTKQAATAMAETANTAKPEAIKVARLAVGALTTEAEAEQKLPEQAKGVPAPDKVQANAMLTATAVPVAANAGQSNKEKTEAKTPTTGNVIAAKLSDVEQLTTATKQAGAEAQLDEKMTSGLNGLPRSEQGASTAFTSALANAQATAVESRLAAAAQNVTSTTVHTEQIKQSINLMQQDAAGHMRQQVSLMLSQQIQRAEIRLDPAGLGMMQIKIDLQQDQATVQFTVQQQQARELIEQQLPRLRELLQQQGIQLAEGQVQQQSQQQQQQLAQKGQQHQANAEMSDEEAQAMPIQVTVKQSERLVDYYA